MSACLFSDSYWVRNARMRPGILHVTLRDDTGICSDLPLQCSIIHTMNIHNIYYAQGRRNMHIEGGKETLREQWRDLRVNRG